jgi:hypothetical protein
MAGLNPITYLTAYLTAYLDACGRTGGKPGSGLDKGAVWPMVVVVLGVLAQRNCGVPLVGDEESVEELAADGADEAFGDRVRTAAPGPVRG